MHTPQPPRPPCPAQPGAVPRDSDEYLVARLRAQPGGGTGHPLAVLLARHWAPVHDYAVICLASSASAASMVTSAAFQQVLDRRSELSAVALRPHLLVTVRDGVKAWSSDEHISSILPDLRKPAGARGIRVTQSMTPENRKLAFRSFQAMPALAQCVLWHTEVEAEPISEPAGLLGIAADLATASLKQAREAFRDGCVRAHQELAPSQDCRNLNRLLDVPIRRGYSLLPDVQQHLVECRHCRYAADQLGHFDGGLGTLLAEAVLGWGARRYLNSRPGRTSQGSRPRRHSSHKGGRRTGNDSLALLPRTPKPDSGSPRSRGGHAADAGSPVRTKVLITGIGVASVALLATVLTAEMWSDDDAGPVASSSPSDRASAPATASEGVPPTSAGLPSATSRTRLRNVAADLCLDIRGGTATKGAMAELSVCTDARTQQWTHENDGRLRSAADPELCLDSNQADGMALLGTCVSASAKNADDVRYDLTGEGELIPRRQKKLALTPVTPEVDSDVVVKVRDGSQQQRWLTDGFVPSHSADPESLSIEGTGTPATQAAATDDGGTAAAAEEQRDRSPSQTEKDRTPRGADEDDASRFRARDEGDRDGERASKVKRVSGPEGPGF